MIQKQTSSAAEVSSSRLVRRNFVDTPQSRLRDLVEDWLREVGVPVRPTTNVFESTEDYTTRINEAAKQANVTISSERYEDTRETVVVVAPNEKADRLEPARKPLNEGT